MDALPIWLDVMAMSIAGAFGAATARNRDIPVAGVLLAAVVVGLGGGMVRDVLLGLEPAAIAIWYYIPCVLIAGVVGALVSSMLLAERSVYLIVMGATLALLVVIGTQKAIAYDAPFPSAILLGVVTASMGGALADVMAGERATVMKQAHWFLSALIVSAIGFWLISVYVSFWGATIATVACLATARVLSVRRGWHCPQFPS